MKTDTIQISSSKAEIEKALQQAEKMAVYKELSKKGALHLRLLTEELMSLVRAIVGDVACEFWIEDQNGLYQLHLLASVVTDWDKRQELISASSSGKNEEAKGLIGKLKVFFSQTDDFRNGMAFGTALTSGMYSGDESVFLMANINTGIETMAMRNFQRANYEDAPGGMDYEWTMSHYRDALSEQRDRDSGAKEDWDELEKSVLGKLADDVKVGILGTRVELVVQKILA